MPTTDRICQICHCTPDARCARPFELGDRCELLEHAVCTACVDFAAATADHLRRHNGDVHGYMMLLLLHHLKDRT